jgi:T-complex protein 1 subunit eta
LCAEWFGQIIIAGLRRSCALALSKIQEIAIKNEDGPEFRRMLETCAGTALNSKLIARYKVCNLEKM